MQDATEMRRPKAAGGRKWIVLVGTAVLGAIALGACGGESASPRSSATARPNVTLATFVAEADEICADYESEFMSVEFPKTDPAAPDAPKAALRQAAIALPEIAAIERDMIAELRALPIPEEFEDVRNQGLDLLLEWGEQMDVAGEAAAMGDRKAIAKAAAAADKAGTRANRLVADWGFKVCGASG